MICIFTKYNSGDQMKKIEMGGARGTYGAEERRTQDFGGQIQGKETAWKNQAQMGGQH